MGGFFDPKEQEVSSTRETGLSKEFKPYLKSGLNMAEALRTDPRELPDFPFTPDMDPYRRAGLEGMAGLGAGGGAVVGSAVDELNRTLSGEYLEPEALDRATRGAVNRAMPGVNAAFFGQGGGGGLRGAAMTEALGNVISDQYGRERDRMVRASSLAPSIENLAYSPFRSMIDAGSAFEEDEQRQISEQLFRHQFEQDEPRQRMSEYMTALGGMLPYADTTTTDTSTVYGQSPFMTTLGLATGVAGMPVTGGGSLGGNWLSRRMGGSTGTLPSGNMNMWAEPAWMWN